MKLLITTALILASVCAHADTTISATQRSAYSANAGWINFRPDAGSSAQGVVVNEFYLSGMAYGANVGWINFGSGTPANGVGYQNNSANDFGVNHDGAGNLSGMAYGANFGWINFGWAAANDPNRPRIDLLTGTFAGYAHSGNLGWINLGGGTLATATMQVTDSDNDGIADAWERTYFGNLTSAGTTTDADKDGVSDLAEYRAGTAPDNATDFFRSTTSAINEGTHQATLTFTTDPTRLYRIETSDDLSSWTNSSLGTFSPDAGTSTTRTFTWSGSGKKFFRAVAMRPLQ